MLLERAWWTGRALSFLKTAIPKPGIRNLASNFPGNKTTPRWQRYLRRTGYLGLGVGIVWGVDTQFNASALGRNLRTLWACALITYEYKRNFTPEKSEQIPELHERVADILFNLFTSNGGLYIKIGQAIGANAAFLPPPVQIKFASLFDDAPQIPLSEILSVFKSEFGRPPSGPNGVFEYFDERAIASASIAQVHKARMWPGPGQAEGEGEWVAVKVQKPAVGKQTEWDLGAYRIVMWLFEKVAFDLPVYFVVDFISDHLREELDFVMESENAERTAAFVAADPRLSQTVYIPRVFPALTTKRIMTAEWIDGVRLSDRDGILRLVGELPGVAKPLRGGTRAIMEPMVELFSAQMFRWGWVHCDPHPGNVIVRPHPAAPRTPQIVLLDHGLYVQLTEEFRREWCAVWEGLLAGEWGVVDGVTRKWGMGMPDMFASTVLMRPVKLKRGRPQQDPRLRKKPIEEMDHYERSVIMKAMLKAFLIDTDRMPKVLIFLLRNMRMVQGNNKSLGSPVNRIKITGFSASRALTRSNPHADLRTRLSEYYHYAIFRSVMLSIDLAFWLARTRQWLWRLLGSKRAGMGFEDELERSMRGMAKSGFGLDLGPDAFDG
ncbi:ABC1 family-domain-containing protein [Mycena alexandri]|uniref:ABC1 family-domain-containing protein n=1 Tax=Mycena alexandri TaxID=1745969 RepID=A0AAD6SP32_9AGAR|nr:ABC1 family-domain-containing protein [Mycena alexandri]